MPSGVGATRPSCNSAGMFRPLLPSGTVRVLSGSGKFRRQRYRLPALRAVSDGYRMSRRLGEGIGSQTIRNVAVTGQSEFGGLFQRSGREGKVLGRVLYHPD